MTQEEAKNKMEAMTKNVGSLWLPEGFSLGVYVPMEIANLTRAYYDAQNPFGGMGGFAAGEPFWYKGIKCFATPDPPKK